MSTANELFNKIQKFYDQELADVPNEIYYEVGEMIESDRQSRREAHQEETEEEDV